MKVSILMPTVFPPLANRMIECIRNTQYPDYEIVVCSPEQFSGEHVVWTKDVRCAGTNPAMRQAFEASSGDIVVSVCDDRKLIPNWLEYAFEEFNTSPQDLWGLHEFEIPGIFGKVFAAFPMCYREMITRNWNHYFTYLSHYGDPEFSLAVWREGRRVIQMQRRIVLSIGPDRLGCGESKLCRDSTSLKEGAERIYADFPEFSQGWDKNPAVFNAHLGIR